MLVDRAGVEVQDLRDHRDFAACALDGLADVLRLDTSELFVVVLDEHREPAQQPSAVGRHHRAPGREGGPRARNRGVHLLGARLVELDDRLFGRRVENGDAHARRSFR